MNPDNFYKEYGIRVMIASSSLQMPFFHLHDGYEVYLLLCGDRTYFIEDDLIRLRDGEIALIPPFTLHKTGGKQGHRILLELSNTFLKRYFTDEAIKQLTTCFKLPHRITTKEQFDKLTSIFSEMIKLEERYEIDGMFVLVAELFKVLSACSIASEKQTQSEHLVANITEYVNEKYAEIKGVEQTAEKFYINKCYLCRVFKKVTGVPFVTYLNNVRLGHASDLLISSNKDISEIALLCGFNSTAYFCNVFKDEFGITPRAYRVANHR